MNFVGTKLLEPPSQQLFVPYEEAQTQALSTGLLQGSVWKC